MKALGVKHHRNEDMIEGDEEESQMTHSYRDGSDSLGPAAAAYDDAEEGDVEVMRTASPATARKSRMTSKNSVDMSQHTDTDDDQPDGEEATQICDVDSDFDGAVDRGVETKVKAEPVGGTVDVKPDAAPSSLSSSSSTASASVSASASSSASSSSSSSASATAAKPKQEPKQGGRNGRNVSSLVSKNSASKTNTSSFSFKPPSYLKKKMKGKKAA